MIGLGPPRGLILEGVLFVMDGIIIFQYKVNFEMDYVDYGNIETSKS